jgi:hypothetical protein
MSHGQTQTHKIQHGLDLGEATTFPLIVFFVHGHGANTPTSFCPETFKLGVPKFPKLRLAWLWKPKTSCVDLWLRWGLKKSYSPCQEFSKGMWQATYMQVNRGNSRLLVVGSQIGSLIPDPSFGHDLCFKYPNGSCEPILNIYVPRYFQWYNKLFDPMSFDPCNCLLKIQESIGILIPKWELTWECEDWFPHILLHSREYQMWLSGFILGPHLCKPLSWLRAQG